MQKFDKVILFLVFGYCVSINSNKQSQANHRKHSLKLSQARQNSGSLKSLAKSATFFCSKRRFKKMKKGLIACTHVLRQIGEKMRKKCVQELREKFPNCEHLLPDDKEMEQKETIYEPFKIRSKDLNLINQNHSGQMTESTSEEVYE